MKKALSLILALVMCLSLCACGSEEITPTTEPEATPLEVGDTTKTDVAEFAITRFEFAKKLKDATFTSGKAPDPEYLLPTDLDQYNNPFAAGDGKIMISFSYTLKNIGKEALKFNTNLGIVIDYDNSYKFEPKVNCIKGIYVVLGGDTTLDPLSDACEGRGYVMVPLEVMNSDAPILLTVSIPTNTEGTQTTEITYKIR